ncbi:hypothetical protein ACFLTK_03390 [Chloroflexota bacterium]
MRLIIITGLLLAVLLGGSCAPMHDFDSRLHSIVAPHGFSITSWEFRTISDEIGQLAFSGEREAEDELGEVMRYFLLVDQIKTLEPKIEAINTGNGQDDLTSLEAEINMLQEQKKALANAVERIIARQIKATLAQQGIFNPIDEYIRLEVAFPPVNFKLEKPPHLLVISPRDRIESMREITLQPSVSLKEIEDIEAKVDRLGVSSLVVELGGIAAYPSVIADDINLWFTIDTVTEEWLHQYLIFKPLGFLYVLDLIGLYRNYEIAAINETLASMVSKEIGTIVYQEYYLKPENGTHQNQVAESGFDFNQEMRNIRRTVDEYLTRSEVEQAEEFMEQKRQYLASKGYYIRKLNQAYFAFYGTYADRPTSISPIGTELKKLRSQSDSLKDFLDTAARITSRQGLVGSIR